MCVSWFHFVFYRGHISNMLCVKIFVLFWRIFPALSACHWSFPSCGSPLVFHLSCYTSLVHFSTCAPLLTPSLDSSSSCVSCLFAFGLCVFCSAHFLAFVCSSWISLIVKSSPDFTHGELEESSQIGHSLCLNHIQVTEGNVHQLLGLQITSTSNHTCGLHKHPCACRH